MTKHVCDFLVLALVINFASLHAQECEICSENTYCYQDKLFNCTAYSTSPAGSVNYTQCSCLPGFYGNTDHDQTCYPCGLHYFCPGGKTRQPCPANTRATSEYSVGESECVCELGYRLEGSECVACLRGTYKNHIGNGGCTLCPSNTFSNTLASSSQSNCLPCENANSSVGSGAITDCSCLVGFARNRDTQVCTACPRGEYQPGRNATTCEKCPLGSYAYETGSPLCTPCQPFSSTDYRGAKTIGECTCNSGYILEVGEDHTCHHCSAGTYAATVTECYECPALTYQDELAKTSCKNCSEHSTQPSLGATSSLDCKCDAGFFMGDDNVTCTACPAGKFKGLSGNGFSLCVECEAGKFSTEASSHCTQCAVDLFSLAGSASCSGCPSNSTTLELATSINSCLCLPGFQRVGDLCVKCPFGFFKPTTDNVMCTQCEPGFTTTYRMSSSAGDCKGCLQNQYAKQTEGGDIICRDCPVPSYSDPRSDNITDCKCGIGYGFYNNLCLKCGFGKYKPVLDSTPCISCPDGMTGVNKTSSQLNRWKSGSCQNCPANFYERDNICYECPAHSLSPELSSSIDHCLCVAGHEKTETGHCRACAVGKFKSDNNSIQVCSPCPANTFANVTGAEVCTPCPGNSSSNSGSDEKSDCECNRGFIPDVEHYCLACEPGTYENNSVCLSCPANHYYEASPPPYFLPRCKRCPRNSTTTEKAYSIYACECTPGFRKEGSQCVPCEADHYCPTQHEMYACPLNSSSSTLSSSIENCTCDPGFYGLLTDTSPQCEICPADQYCPGGSEIQNCPGNSSTVTLNGRPTIDDCICLPGFYAKENSTQCILCPRDTYCYNEEILQCPHNSSSVRGSDLMVDCLCNKGFRDITNDTVRECEVCPPNFLCPGQGLPVQECATGAVNVNDECKCANGFFCPSGDSSCLKGEECTLCPAGRHYCRDNFKFECFENAYTLPGSWHVDNCTCEPGKYKEPPETCRTCPPNHYCRDNAMLRCAAHDPNLFLPTLGNDERKDCICDDGFFRINTEDLCKPCPKNFYCPLDGTMQAPNVIQCMENEYTVSELSTRKLDCICDAGHKMSKDGEVTKCLPCGQGERCQFGQVLEEACHLQNREPNHDHSACICMPGFFEDTDLTCKPCHPGSIKPDAGNTLCDLCDPGTFWVNTTNCKVCPDTFTSVAGKTSCVCPFGQEEQNAVCVPCTAGNYYTDEPDPHASEYTSGRCEVCPSHSDSEDGAEDLEDCKCLRGYIRGSVEFCEACPRGKYEEDGVCKACVANSTSAPASSSKDDCTCQVCMHKTWVPVDDGCYGECHFGTQCVGCELGHFKDSISGPDNEDECHACSFGKYQHNVNASFCYNCAHTRTTQHTGSNNASACICKSGFEPVSEDYMRNCSQCSLGFFKASMGDYDCPPCAANFFSDVTGQTTCKFCGDFTTVRDANFTIHEGSEDVENCTCTRGYYRNYSTNGCEACLPGAFKHEVGSQECNYCGHGPSYFHHFTNLVNQSASTSSVICEECPDNAGEDPDDIGPFPLKQMLGVESCQCFPGFEHFSPDTGCEECKEFMFRETYSKDDCQFCADNHYWNARNIPCSLCFLQDSYEEAHHHIAINSINTSLHWGTSEADCVCREGYYRDNEHCVECQVGKFRTFDTGVHLSCTPCPNNTYTEEKRTIYCTDCPPHSFTARVGRALRSDCLCEAGYEWNGTHCNGCLPGFFKNESDTEEERKVCVRCHDGFYTDTHATVYCTECNVNMHSELPRDSVDNCECNPGFGGTPCTSCVHGTFSAGGTLDDQHAECLICPEGKTTVTTESTVIEECLCEPGFGTSDNASTAACHLCQDGFYAPGLENIPCTHCGYGGITHPELGAINFDACMCNHELGLFEERFYREEVLEVQVSTELAVSLDEWTEDVEMEYRKSLAETAGVSVDDVIVLSVEETPGSGRRLLSSSPSITVKCKIRRVLSFDTLMAQEEIVDPDSGRRSIVIKSNIVTPDTMDPEKAVEQIKTSVTPERLKSKMAKQPTFKKQAKKWIEGLTGVSAEKYVAPPTTTPIMTTPKPDDNACVGGVDSMVLQYNFDDDTDMGLDSGQYSNDATAYSVQASTEQVKQGISSAVMSNTNYLQVPSISLDYDEISIAFWIQVDLDTTMKPSWNRIFRLHNSNSKTISCGFFRDYRPGLAIFVGNGASADTYSQVDEANGPGVGDNNVAEIILHNHEWYHITWSMSVQQEWHIDVFDIGVYLTGTFTHERNIYNDNIINSKTAKPSWFY